MGYIADKYGLSQVFIAAAVCGVIGTVFISILLIKTIWKANHAAVAATSSEKV